MITIKPVVRKRALTKINLAKSVKGQNMVLFPIQIYVNDRGKVYYIATDFTTTNENHLGCVFMDRDKTAIQNQRLTDRLYKVYNDCQSFADDHSGMPWDIIKEGLRRIVKGEQAPDVDRSGLADLFAEYSKYKNHTEGTTKIYKGTLICIERYDPKADIRLINKEWVENWRKDMSKRLDVNTIAIHMRNLRAICNYAKKKKLVKEYAFEEIRIGTKRSYHRVLSVADVCKLRDHCCEDWQEVYRDIFLLMIYLGGIDLTDLMLMKKPKGDRLVFVRNKNRNRINKVEVSLPILPEAWKIIKKYEGKKRLLNIAENLVFAESFQHSLNDALKTIGEVEWVEDRLGKNRKVKYHPFFPDISSKTARRTFATIAIRMGIQERLIGMILGHSWTASNTTQIYEYFTQEDVDMALKKVVDAISQYGK